MKRIILIALFIFGSQTLEFPSAWGQAKDTFKESPTVERASPTIISAGDTLSISVMPVEEYSRELTVAPDGRIEMPLIGSLLVKGLTTTELQDILQKKYARYIANPQVSINVKHFSGRRVAIIGDVRSPGYFEYRDGMGLLELVSIATGFNDFAKTSEIWILRRGPDGKNRSFLVNFSKVLHGD